MFHSVRLVVLEGMFISVLTIFPFPLLALPAFFFLTTMTVPKQTIMNGIAYWVSK